MSLGTRMLSHWPVWAVEKCELAYCLFGCLRLLECSLLESFFMGPRMCCHQDHLSTDTHITRAAAHHELCEASHTYRRKS